MVARQKRRENRQVLRVMLLLALLMPVARPGLGQELKQVSPTLAAKIAESGRKRVAVVDFTDLQGNVTELGRYLAEELSGALVNDARGFHVMDRAHLKAILQEHKLSSTGLINPQTARQLGQFAGVDTLVTGTITSAFGDSVRMMVKALDVSTAEIIAQSSADIPKTDAIKSLLG
jgi:curli biogenesis system outer membrane secretion channel CsgG